MTQGQIEHDYFEWVRDLVCGDRFSEENSYDKLLRHLYSIPFTKFIHPKDSNRASDGLNLRYRYGYFNGVKHAEDYIGGPCSVLEMMVALAVRCEEEIMDNPKYGDRTGQWFWGMINNLGLGGMTDRNYDPDYVIDIIERMIYREYEPNGRGGLFSVAYSRVDMRKIEIWSQLSRFLEERGD